MAHRDPAIDEVAAVDRLMRLLAVEGTTGHEAAISREVTERLIQVGVPAKAIRSDSAHERIPLPTPVGNLIAEIPGTVDGPRRLFMAHLDTVPLCSGAKPIRAGKKITTDGSTALGGDDRTGVAVLINLAAYLLQHKPAHPPITLLFTVREESGLFGARHIDPKDLNGPKMAFNFDGKSASDFTIGAVGAERWDVEIRGRASHAGVAPEKGISATAVASLAIADVVRGGWFGKVVRGEQVGTSNVGSVAGADGQSAGRATNVVTDFVRVHGESRSHDPKFAKAITAAYKAAFAAAAKDVKDDRGKTAKVKFTSRLDYAPFRLKSDAPVVRHALAAAESIGLKPTTKVGNGGLDANWMVRHGIPTVTAGAGQNAIHTVEEFVDLTEYLAGCRLAVALAVYSPKD